MTRPPAEEVLRLLVERPGLSPRFARWRTTLAPGAVRPTSGPEWAGAMVLITRGELEVDCAVGGLWRFEAGDVLVLGMLPLRTLRNPGVGPTHLIAVRRRAPGGFCRDDLPGHSSASGRSNSGNR